MNENNSVTPHDDFFKLQMEVKDKAVAFIRASFPAEILHKLNLSTLRLSKNTFTDGEQGNFAADVVYECEFGERGRKVMLTLLFEHKSYIVEFPHLQLLKYIIGIWLQESKNRKPLLPVLPVLFYHGERDWEIRRFEEYFEGGEIEPDLQRFIPSFEFLFFSLSRLGEDWIMREIDLPGLQLAMKLMLHVTSSDLLSKLVSIVEELERFEAGGGDKREVEENYLYLSQGTKMSREEIREYMDHATFMKRPHPEGSLAWHIAQEAKAEALAEGMAEGMALGEAKGIALGEAKGIALGEEKGKAEVARNLIKKGFDLSVISEATGFSLEEIEKMNPETV